jgi:hypothetical protein
MPPHSNTCRLHKVMRPTIRPSAFSWRKRESESPIHNDWKQPQCQARQPQALTQLPQPSRRRPRRVHLILQIPGAPPFRLQSLQLGRTLSSERLRPRPRTSLFRRTEPILKFPPNLFMRRVFRRAPPISEPNSIGLRRTGQSVSMPVRE